MAAQSSKYMKRRQERLDEEAKQAAAERRQRMIRYGVIGVFAAIVVVAVMIAVSQSGSDDEGASGAGAGGDVVGVTETDNLLAGLDQDATMLGDPDAEVTITEFGDLQCPVCRQFSEDTVTPLIETEVRNGDANIQFLNWTILGEDSVTAANAALAAAEQGRYWEFVELFYLNQGTENSGYVTDDFLRSIADAAGVADLEKWEDDRSSGDFDTQLEDNAAQATENGFQGTPSFLVSGPNGDMALGTVPLPQIRAAIEEVSGG